MRVHCTSEEPFATISMKMEKISQTATANTATQRDGPSRGRGVPLGALVVFPRDSCVGIFFAPSLCVSWSMIWVPGGV